MRRGIHHTSLMVRVAPSLTRLLAPTLVLVTLTGCATIGPAVPELSGLVGRRMAEMQSLHETAIRKMFDGERRRVDDFLDQHWIPLFLQNYLGQSNIIATVSKPSTISSDRQATIANSLKSYLADSTEAPQVAIAVVEAIERGRANEAGVVRKELARFVPDNKVHPALTHTMALIGTSDPASELLAWASAAEHEIRAQREKMLAPIDEAEEQVLSDLGNNYDQVMAAQGVVTARLEAAAKLKTTQDSALRALGVDDAYEQARQRAVGVSGAVSRALEQMEQLSSNDLLQGTRVSDVLRDALRQPNTDPISTATRDGK